MSEAMRRGSGVPLAALACVAAALLAGCAGGSGNANKAGAAIEPKVTLHLEMPDAADPRGTFFAREVERRSGGSVEVLIDRNRYSSEKPANELALARALQAGREDIAYIPARAWSAAGLPAFHTLLAPFMITTERAGQAVAEGPLAKRILATLPRTVVGIALVPDKPRRVLANRPVDSPASFAGLRIRIIDNPQTALDFEALGAKPVQGLDANQTGRALQRRTVDAVESSTATMLENGYFTFARYLSGYSVFPKFQSIVVSRPAWAKLSSAQRTAIREAASATVAEAGRRIPVEGQKELKSLCEAHVAVSRASAAEMREFAAAAKSPQTMLANGLGTAKTFAALEGVPGTGPRPLDGPLPAVCRGLGSAQAGTPAKGGASIPNGVYVVTNTPADWAAGNVINDETGKPVTFTTTLRDGRWYQTQSPNYPDQGPFSGTYSVHGDKVVFVMLKAGVHGENDITAPETVRWSYFDGLLRFTIVDVLDNGSKVLYAAHPWRKIR
jgi:TRAP-type C4-dicarboxylate transport system substrate-binding protein